MKVRIQCGAEAAYACITMETRTMDVRLPPGKLAPAAMRQVASELREKARALIDRAEIIEHASELI